ncbi:winged helix-turn-helix domain-containing protein [Thalassomonas sp. RHCl1]|uniref:winged helix-turn-helix domain-containing protein n=1 Tax=Thalassomonas sp. RHCl1 TaxID=2995320 RepID=UPI00248CC099|nr:winged helix-turn-helix domain-containing protein [Thalassomonas sp. RHCl1]
MAYLKIGEFQLDIERSRIINNGETIALEPKVLEVLLVLAERPGRVVPKAEIIEKVWGDVVVEANALHRCIRQLRKAFNDNVKEQSYIETHPRKGYSLVAEVSKETDTKADEKQKLGANSISVAPTNKTGRYWLLLLILLVPIAVYFLPKETGHIYQFNNLTPLTATDAVESNSVFSPDGKYVTFLRDNTNGADHIWWLNIATKEEYRLTKEPGNYRNLAWSPDGERIAFTHVIADENSYCMQVESLYVPLAISSPQATSILAECDDSHYESPQWLDDKRFFVIQHANKQSSVILFNSESGKGKRIFSDTKAKVHALAMSQAVKKLAITILADQHKPRIFIYNIEDKSSEPLSFNIPQKYSNFFHWHPTWDHVGEGFVFSVGRYLLHMNMAGNFTELHSSDSPDLRLADVSSTGNSIVMTMGKADRDIYIRPLSDRNEISAKVVGRSIVKEFDAKFNPKSEEVAFLSERNGVTNVWVEQVNGTKQVSNMPEGVEQFVWSQSGKEILLFHGGKLTIVSLSNKEQVSKPVETDVKITRIFQWFNQTQLLCSTFNQGKHQLISLNIENGGFETLYDGHVYWAQLDEGKLVISDQNEQIFSVDNADAVNITIEKELAPQAPFFLRKGYLYLLSSSKELWRYHLESKGLEYLTRFSRGDTWLNDVDHQSKRLLTSEIQIRQTELVSFHN